MKTWINSISYTVECSCGHEIELFVRAGSTVGEIDPTEAAREALQDEGWREGLGTKDLVCPTCCVPIYKDIDADYNNFKELQ